MEETPQIVVFGEMLWDMIPTGKKPGGAPMNVAMHLNNLGISTAFISKIGEDELGEELLDFVHERSVNTQWIQKDPAYVTGIVNVNMDDATEVVYEIVQPVAWDFIEWKPEMEMLVKKSQAFVYETLAARHTTSHETLFQLLKNAPFNVLDVNLRPPFYTVALLDQLFQYAHLVKINHHELADATPTLDSSASIKDRSLTLMKLYPNISGIIATRGANGAMFTDRSGNTFEHPGFNVDVKDTIGSGDSFLAAFLSQWIDGKEVATCLEYACALGAMVATHSGANPAISISDVEEFIQSQHV